MVEAAMRPAGRGESMMSAQHAIARQLWSAPKHRVPAPAPLAADTETGFARIFVPTLLAVVLATGCVGWDSWVESDGPPSGMVHVTR
jgi:hypothetical protein